MSALLITEMTVEDAAERAAYRRRLSPVMLRFGGRLLGPGDGPTSMAGDRQPDSMLVAEFPDRDAIRDFLRSDEYRQRQ